MFKIKRGVTRKLKQIQGGGQIFIKGGFGATFTKLQRPKNAVKSERRAENLGFEFKEGSIKDQS